MNSALPPNLTAAKFKQWSIEHKPFAETVCKAKAMAEVERKRVDAYILPIFESFAFVDKHGKQIQQLRDAHLCTDKERHREYLAQCDEAHRAHGFTGPQGNCPALMAETLLMDAENVLIVAGCNFFGCKFSSIYGEKRHEFLELLLKSCLSV